MPYHVAARAGANRPALPGRKGRPPRGPKRRTTGGEFRYCVDARGRQHFNFRQRIWLHPAVDMAVTPVMTVALETLAINLLTRLTRKRDCCAAVGLTSRRMLRLAPRFCVECLLGGQPGGWVMPRAALRAWLSSHARPSRDGKARIRRAGARAGAGTGLGAVRGARVVRPPYDQDLAELKSMQRRK
ncbi:MAG: hypothetical protein ACRD3Q_13930 [Terriglobales bacterium]